MVEHERFIAAAGRASTAYDGKVNHSLWNRPDLSGRFSYAQKPACVCCGEQNALDYFVQDDDGAGDLRGKLVDSIQRCLERRDAAYQTRWDKVWSSALCQRYRRLNPMITGCGHGRFMMLQVIDLRAIATLVQLPVK